MVKKTSSAVMAGLINALVSVAGISSQAHAAIGSVMQMIDTVLQQQAGR